MEAKCSVQRVIERNELDAVCRGELQDRRN